MSGDERLQIAPRLVVYNNITSSTPLRVAFGPPLMACNFDLDQNDQNLIFIECLSIRDGALHLDCCNYTDIRMQQTPRGSNLWWNATSFTEDDLNKVYRIHFQVACFKLTPTSLLWWQSLGKQREQIHACRHSHLENTLPHALRSFHTHKELSIYQIDSESKLQTLLQWRLAID